MGKKGSRAHLTGSDVVWKGKPRIRLKKGSGAQGEVKPRRKVQLGAAGVTHIWPIDGFDMAQVQFLERG